MIELEFRRRPATLSYMRSALRFRPGLGTGGRFPEIAVRWIGHRVDPRQLHEFLTLSGLAPTTLQPLLYLHSVSFPLQMVILTHRKFPVPIWRMLQVRNHLLQHRSLPADAPMDIAFRVAGQRSLEKGTEVDLLGEARAKGELVWEGLTSFYFRGRTGAMDIASPPVQAPEPSGDLVAELRMPNHGRWRFGAITGDYNGIHLWDWYARLFGFKRALLHPQRVLGYCMERLAQGNCEGMLRLDAWLKGPVHYRSEVRLRARVSDADTTFALTTEDDARPSILGRLRRVAPGSRLVDIAGRIAS